MGGSRGFITHCTPWKPCRISETVTGLDDETPKASLFLLVCFGNRARETQCDSQRDAVGGILLPRAVGEFRLVGFFKRVRGSGCARLDTFVYSPLCLALAVGIFAVGHG